MLMFWLFLIVLVLCISILFGAYMYFCAENEIRMFSNADKETENWIRRIDDRVKTIEKKMETEECQH